MKDDVVEGRCRWCLSDPLYIAYHDQEWGYLETNRLFEKIVLEGAQAGLSWLTILKRRDNYRKAFHDFIPQKVAAMTEADVERLMQFDGIIRNRRKIESAISNANRFMSVQKEFGSFFNYISSFLPDGKPVDNHPRSIADIPATTSLSDAISRDMKRRGFKFFGSAICYAFLQANGFVNDHLEECNYRKSIEIQNI